ncbi:hypothetical protein MCP1_150032 [Candidatus Terasakiella magnetica]|nr:hypothetical protein MCP1_150032 [Candidatus Terasakiella magnetica]
MLTRRAFLLILIALAGTMGGYLLALRRRDGLKR